MAASWLSGLEAPGAWARSCLVSDEGEHQRRQGDGQAGPDGQPRWLAPSAAGVPRRWASSQGGRRLPRALAQVSVTMCTWSVARRTCTQLPHLMRARVHTAGPTLPLPMSVTFSLNQSALVCAGELNPPATASWQLAMKVWASESRQLVTARRGDNAPGGCRNLVKAVGGTMTPTMILLLADA